MKKGNFYKKKFFLKKFHTKKCFNKKAHSTKNKCKADGPIFLGNTDIQTVTPKLWEKYFPEVGQCSYSVANKNPFQPFLDTI